MAITMECSKDATGAKDVSKDHGYPEGKIVVRTFAEGCVLDTWERNGYDDSDFYALIWNEEKQCVESVEYATTRGWTYANGATIDATPEVQAKAREHYVKTVTAAFIRNSVDEAKEPQKGRTCKVVKGRKIAKGTIVEVVGEPVSRKYTMSRWEQPTVTVLVREVESGNLVHTNVKNLEVLNPEKYHKTEAVAAAEARHAVEGSNWRSMGYLEMPASMLRALAGRF